MAIEDAGNEVQWGLGDNLGTIRLVVNAAGEVQNRIVYDSFGEVVSESNPGVDFRYGFTGRELDSETGLVYYRARYYDGGRFISEDPIGFGGGDGNLYRYVGNSPTIFTDPSGNQAATRGIGFRLPLWWRIILSPSGGGGLLNPRPLSDGTLPPGRDPNGLTKSGNPPPLTTPPFPAPTPGSQERPGDFGPTPGLDLPNHTTFPGSNEGVGPNVESFPKNSCPAIPPFLESDQSSGSGGDPESGGDLTVDDLIGRSKPGRKTKGRSRQFETPGGLQEANDAFDDLNPSNVQEIDTGFGRGRRGTLPDGRTIIVRPGSSNSGPPTLEIQRGRNKIKFRFGD